MDFVLLLEVAWPNCSRNCETSGYRGLNWPKSQMNNCSIPFNISCSCQIVHDPRDLSWVEHDTWDLSWVVHDPWDLSWVYMIKRPVLSSTFSMGPVLGSTWSIGPVLGSAWSMGFVLGSTWSMGSALHGTTSTGIPHYLTLGPVPSKRDSQERAYIHQNNVYSGI